jgi:hypothetical protein
LVAISLLAAMICWTCAGAPAGGTASPSGPIVAFGPGVGCAGAGVVGDGAGPSAAAVRSASMSAASSSPSTGRLWACSNTLTAL